MKKIHRVLAMLMAAIMALSLITTAFAEPTIDPSKKASLSIYKYDITTASAEGAWDAESYVSTGLHDDAVVDKLAKYAIQGVEFTCLRVADVTMNNEVVDGQRTVGVLYGFDSSDRSNAVLSAIGLTAADAHKTDNGINYFTSDTLNNKLSAALTANATTVKNALEAAVKNGGMAMPETDAAGHTSASNMEQGLYLVVETRVPENVTSTCNPFFVSLPMTTIDGTAWNYDVTVYPKNQTGNPTLDKTVREAKNSTGKNTGSLTDITDGYAHTATASVGDTVDYQIISILLIQIAVGSLYMFSVPRGYGDGFTQWCKQVVGLCLTAFLQATILVAGLMVFKDHALLGLGLMLSAGEIPRIAGAFGLDTTTRANISSAVYTAQSAVSMARTVVAAAK